MSNLYNYQNIPMIINYILKQSDFYADSINVLLNIYQNENEDDEIVSKEIEQELTQKNFNDLEFVTKVN